MKIHPLDGNLSDDEKIGFWDVFAETYSSEQQGNMPAMITEWLSETGVLGIDKTLLEIGSGPGTYSVLFAPESKHVTCLDSSVKMLNRLSVLAKHENIENIELLNTDWNSFDSRKKWDVVAATLCSFLGTPESLDKMDSFAEGRCFMVSWVKNHGDDLQNKIWAKLGKEYSFTERNTDNLSETLQNSGREFEIKEFSDRIHIELPIGEVVKRNAHTYSAFGLEKEAAAAIKEILGQCSENGIYVSDAVNTLQVAVWNPIVR